MNKYKLALLLIIPLLCCTSCEEWLKVDSEDRIMEDALYSNENGFRTALNGIYIDLLNSSLYGQTLTTTTFDVLAQYYDTSKPLNTHAYVLLANYDHQKMKDAVSNTWVKGYALIGNINTLLEHCDKNRNVLSDKGYHIIKGETLALRAMLHFDLLRIFGPIYKYEPGKECIPYVNDTERKVKPLLPASDVIFNITTDLKAAEELLADYDPVITEGKLATEDASGNNFYRFRNERMNYFAVLALTARVYLYAGDTGNAVKYANDVIDRASRFFPFATREQVNGQATSGSANTSAEDRIFSSEILFGNYHSKRTTDIFDKTFSYKLEAKNVLKMSDYGISQLYEDDGDLRKCQWQTQRDTEGNVGQFFVKYGDVTDNGFEFAKLLPMIRMSEMYLIKAEYTKDYKALNPIRKARNIPQLKSNIGLNGYIEDEYVREFIGEGQLFWYYKRKGITSIPRLYNPNLQDMQITNSTYVFDLPDSEQQLRK